MSNPFYNEKTLEKVENIDSLDMGNTMTIKGAITKSTILFLILLSTSLAVWWKFGGDLLVLNNPIPWLIGSSIASTVLLVVAGFKMNWSPILAPIFAVTEGVFVALATMVFAPLYDGIVMQAAVLTFVIFGIMLFSYRMGWLRATPMFKKIMFYAISAVAVFYLVIIIGYLTGFNALATFYANSSPLSIGLSFVITGIAAFRFILNFDLIERGAEQRAPEFMEWYSGMSLIFTLVWLYIELLRLLSKLRD